MSGFEGEIECLDEDAEIVEQCLSSVNSGISEIITYLPPSHSDLLTERRAPQKRKRRVEKDDSEYEPSDHNLPPSPPSPPTLRKKQKTNLAKKPRPTLVSAAGSSKITRYPQPKPVVMEEFLMRKHYDIRIPDFDDPLCLPVRAVKNTEIDVKRLNNWNNACLQHFKHCDTLLKPEQGTIVKSVRTAVFKNVYNRNTGQNETSIWSKTCVENEDADKKSEIFQSILPKYREKKSLPAYTLIPSNNRDRTVKKTVFEVVLSKEVHKDGEALVAYKPKEGISAVYGLIDKRPRTEEGDIAPSTEECKLFLKELTACRMCTPCFQASWRGIVKNKTYNIRCPICYRTCVTAYNLLSHFKSHTSEQIAQHKSIISRILGHLVEYHYKCRICNMKFNSIKALRCHVKEHQGKGRFTCEICKCVVNGS